MNGIIVIKSTSIRLLLWQSVVKCVVCISMGLINIITVLVEERSNRIFQFSFTNFSLFPLGWFCFSQHEKKK